WNSSFSLKTSSKPERFAPRSKAGRQTAEENSMTIGRKLYVSFGAVLAMVVVLFAVNLTAVYREHSAKAAASQALQLADATDKIRFQMMQNRLYLTNYLLSGDSREADHVNDGVHTLVDRMQNTMT